MSPSEPRWCGGDWWTLHRFRLVRYIFWYCSPYLAAKNLLVVPILRCVLMLLGDVAAKKYEWGIASDARLISIAEVIVILFLLRGQASQLIHKIREMLF